MSDPTMAEPSRNGPTGTEPLTDRAPPAEGTDARDIASRLLGRTPTPAEISESEAYDDLRAILREAREDADLSQAAIAGKMELVQSEVSRLETTVGPGTRFGRLCRYLEACGAHLTVTVRTARERDLIWSTAPDRAASTAAPPSVPAAVAQPMMAWTPAFQTQMLDDILALEESLQQVDLEPAAASRVRHAFLTRLQARQQVPAPPAAYKGVVQSTGPQPVGAASSIPPTWPFFGMPFDPTLFPGAYPLPCFYQPGFYQPAYGTPGPQAASTPSEAPSDIGSAAAAAGKFSG